MIEEETGVPLDSGIAAVGNADAATSVDEAPEMEASPGAAAVQEAPERERKS